MAWLRKNFPPVSLTRRRLGYLNAGHLQRLEGSSLKIDERLSRAIERDSTRGERTVADLLGLDGRGTSSSSITDASRRGPAGGIF